MLFPQDSISMFLFFKIMQYLRFPSPIFIFIKYVRVLDQGILAWTHVYEVCQFFSVIKAVILYVFSKLVYLLKNYAPFKIY